VPNLQIQIEFEKFTNLTWYILFFGFLPVFLLMTIKFKYKLFSVKCAKGNTPVSTLLENIIDVENNFSLVMF
jgi:hypothetical protein